MGTSRIPFLPAYGTIRLGAPPADVPYLGDGQLLLELGPEDSPSELQESIRGGRFTLSLPQGSRARVRGASLQARPVACLGTPPDLAAGAETVLYCAWVDRRVRLHVRDAVTGAELPQVVVHAVLTGPSDEEGFGDPARGPSAEDPVLLRSSSPLELSISATGVHPEYWIAHEGFVPFRYRVPTGFGVFEAWIDLSAGVDATVPLDPLACLQVAVGNLDQALTAQWLTRTRLRCEGLDVPIVSTEVRIERGTVLGQIYFAARGTVDVTFGPLSSYGELRPGSFEFEPGLVRELVLADWIAASVR